MSGVVANCPGQAKVLKRGFDVQVTLSRTASDVVNTDKQLRQLLKHQSASTSILQEQHGVNKFTDTVGPATSQYSLGHYVLKRASFGLHEGGQHTAKLNLHRAEILASVCADALTAATAAFTLAGRLGQDDLVKAKLTAAHTAHNAAVKTLQEAESAYMPYKLHQEIASKAVAIENNAFEQEQKRWLGVYQRCKKLHRQHLLAEQAADKCHGRLTIFAKLQALVSMECRSPAANAVLTPHSRSMPRTPAPQLTALSTAEAAPPPAARSTAEYLRDLAKMCKDRWHMEVEQQAAEAADNSDAHHQLRRWRAAWTGDNPSARLSRLAKMIKGRTLPKGLDWDLTSSKSITLAVLQGLPWLCRSRQALYKQDQLDFGYAWAVETGHNSSTASSSTRQESKSAHYTMQQKHRWQQLQKMSPAAARHMFLTSAVNFTLAATGTYNEAKSADWLTWPARKLPVAQQVSPAWLGTRLCLPPRLARVCTPSIRQVRQLLRKGSCKNKCWQSPVKCSTGGS